MPQINYLPFVANLSSGDNSAGAPCTFTECLEWLRAAFYDCLGDDDSTDDQLNALLPALCDNGKTQSFSPDDTDNIFVFGICPI